MELLSRTLYGVTKKNKVKEWTISVKDIGGEGYVYTCHGLVGGKQAGSMRIVDKGKNIGKSNETTPVQQAMKEAEAKIQKKIDERYRYTVEDAVDAIKENFRPMLAVSFDRHSSRVTYPCFAQPKLDGIRCIARASRYVRGLGPFARNCDCF